MTQGELLKKFRQLKGVKQQTIANCMKISQQAYAKIEKQNKVNDKRLSQILQSLNCNKHDWDNFTKFYLQY